MSQAKPNQAKPRQAKPSQAKPSRGVCHHIIRLQPCAVFINNEYLIVITKKMTYNEHYSINTWRMLRSRQILNSFRDGCRAQILIKANDLSILTADRNRTMSPHATTTASLNIRGTLLISNVIFYRILTRAVYKRYIYRNLYLLTENTNQNLCT